MERYEKLLDLVGETQGQSVTARVVAEENGPFAATPHRQRRHRQRRARGLRRRQRERPCRPGHPRRRIHLTHPAADGFLKPHPRHGHRSRAIAPCWSATAGPAHSCSSRKRPTRSFRAKCGSPPAMMAQVPLGVRVGTARKDGDNLARRPCDGERALSISFASCRRRISPRPKMRRRSAASRRTPTPRCAPSSRRCPRLAAPARRPGRRDQAGGDACTRPAATPPATPPPEVQGGRE